jgi:hypothetical protein
MKNTANASTLSLKSIALVTGVVLVLALGWSGANATVYASHRVITGYDTDIRVWLEDEYDIYPSEDNLVFYIRAARDCYATVYVVDTDGFIHVIHPLSPHDNAYIRGGRVYRFNPYRSDIFYSAVPRGIAYVFAVSSPVPFVYADFGFGIFGGTSSYRIYGDPFIACKRFYLSILPRWVVMDRVSISFSHFYIREWTRFPHYLCRHHHHWAGNGPGHYCDDFDYAYRSYRRHHNDPYQVLRPGAPAPRSERDYTSIVKMKNTQERSVRVRSGKENIAARTRPVSKPAKTVTRTNAPKTHEKAVTRSVEQKRTIQKSAKKSDSKPSKRASSSAKKVRR